MWYRIHLPTFPSAEHHLLTEEFVDLLKAGVTVGSRAKASLFMDLQSSTSFTAYYVALDQHPAIMEMLNRFNATSSEGPLPAELLPIAGEPIEVWKQKGTT